MSFMTKFLNYFHFPFAHHRLLSSISFLLLFIAFILILLVGISLPIVKTVYLLSLKSVVTNQPATSVATELRFGVWGVCATSVLDRSTINSHHCFGPKLGYTVPANLFPLVGFDPTLGTIILKALLVILILHPIVAGISFLSQFFAAFLGSHPLAIIALILAIVAAILGSVVFAVDLAIVLVAKSKISSLNQFHLTVQWGNGIWMVFVGVVCTWIAVVLLSVRVCYCCGVGRSKRKPYNDKTRVTK